MLYRSIKKMLYLRNFLLIINFLFAISFIEKNDLQAIEIFNQFPKACKKQNFNSNKFAENIKEGIVVVSTDDGFGSGFVIGHKNNKTYILTNSHVLDGEKKVLINWSDGHEDIGILEIDGMGVSNINDLAIISVNGKSGKILGFKKGIPNIGSDVIAIGSPKGLNYSFTKGIVSSFREGGKIIQIDAALNEGNSGGPLINKDGCVIGVNTAALNDSENLNFAISGEVAIRFINKLPQKSKINQAQKDSIKDKVYFSCYKKPRPCKPNKEALNYLVRANNIKSFSTKRKYVQEYTTKSLKIQKSDFAYVLRGESFYKENQFDKALNDFTNALLINKNNIDASLYRGLSLQGKGHHQKAIKEFKRVNKINILGNKNENINAFLYMANSYDQINQIENAREAIEEGLKVSSNNIIKSNLYLKKSYYELITNSYDSSEIKSYLNKAISLNSKSEEALYLLGKVFERDQNFDRAIELYTEAIELNPNFSKAYVGIGSIQSNIFDDFGNAIKNFNLAIKINPNNKSAYFNRAMANIDLPGNDPSQIKRSCIDFKKAKSLKGDRLLYRSSSDIANVWLEDFIKKFCL